MLADVNTELEVAKVAWPIIAALGGAFRDRLPGWIRRYWPGESRLKLLYWEVLYNVVALKLSQRFYPPRVFIHNYEWQRPGVAALVGQRLSWTESAAVATAYFEAKMVTDLMNGEPWLDLMIIRLKGEDQVMMQNLAERFKDAEKALRKTVLGRRADKAAEEMAKLELFQPEPIKSIPQRVQGAIPPRLPNEWQLVMVGGFVWLTLSVASDIAGWIRKR